MTIALLLDVPCLVIDNFIITIESLRFELNTSPFFFIFFGFQASSRQQGAFCRLPAGFNDTRKFTLRCKYTKTDAANSELSEKTSGSTADRTTIVSSYFEFGFSHSLHAKRFFCQCFLLNS